MTTITSYIDSTDLEECLDLWFSGTFDDCDQYISRLYKDASELKPGNSLFGQLDSSGLELALWGLGSIHRAAIQFHFIGDETSWSILLHNYLHNGQQGTLESWVAVIYLQALELLSREVMKLI
ncbi:MAG: hypothetical protein RMZ41_001775 [Nostoc sp. DedVER02]|uniref:hypothetical protein n=1 Tax=unclassified Nostoc TaxID=2593658 RepID=UPI002AD3A8E9|nr:MULTISPECIES: hypothetical protein [unclassified Nostoc]MDZ7987112.1 hypothetical protein [Nostoc sp. DedVER02]MDZ8111018.1 hypothetical protein [Nostoc sp. DedVER01b]